MDPNGGTPVIYIAAIACIQVILLAIVVGVVNAHAARQAARLKSEEKAEDWRRQDEVALRVAEAAQQAETAAKLLVAAQEQASERADRVAVEVTVAAKQAADAATLLLNAQADTIARTDKVAALAAESDLRVQSQLAALDVQGKKIHTLVNSDMTLARMNERDTMMQHLASLKLVQALSIRLEGNALTGRRAEDVEVLEEGRIAIEAAQKRIEELNQILAERAAAQQKVDSENSTVTAVVENTAVIENVSETLRRIEVNTEATAENTKHTS